MTSTAQLDRLMESASQALAARDYLACETLCLQALTQARQARLWAYYARILLPLQECRRHRRMIAAEGVIRLGTTTLAAPLPTWLHHVRAGCLVVTPPYAVQDAQALEQAARAQQCFIEVLYADHPAAGSWTFRSCASSNSGGGGDIFVNIPDPPAEWIDRDLPAAATTAFPSAPGSRTPADWFLDAGEALGDAALTKVRAPLGTLERVTELEDCLAVLTDHEIIHQELVEAATALARLRS